MRSTVLSCCGGVVCSGDIHSGSVTTIIIETSSSSMTAFSLLEQLVVWMMISSIVAYILLKCLAVTKTANHANVGLYPVVKYTIVLCREEGDFKAVGRRNYDVATMYVLVSNKHIITPNKYFQSLPINRHKHVCVCVIIDRPFDVWVFWRRITISSHLLTCLKVVSTVIMHDHDRNQPSSEISKCLHYHLLLCIYPSQCNMYPSMMDTLSSPIW